MSTTTSENGLGCLSITAWRGSRLLMQLVGEVGVVSMTGLALAPIVTPAPGPNAASGYVFFFAVLCGPRSAFHRAAGTALVHGESQPPRRALWTYVAISLVQTAGVLLIVSPQCSYGPGSSWFV